MQFYIITMWLVHIQTETLVYPTPSYGKKKKKPKLKLLKVLKVLRTDSRKWLKLKQVFFKISI